jgi:hypothetical protein
LFIGCEQKDSNVDKRIKNSTENPKIESFKKISWNNPMLTPFGKDLVSIIRCYFLVGEVDKLMNFIIKPIGYTDGQLKEIIRKSTWGYEVKVTDSLGLALAFFGFCNISCCFVFHSNKNG